MRRKKYRVEISKAAEHDVVCYKNFIAADKPMAAAKWARMAYTKMRSLRYFPMRFEVIPEVEEIQFPYRYIIWGNYRIIYEVGDDVVTIARVLQASQLLRPRHFQK